MSCAAEAVRTEMQGRVREIVALAPDENRKAALDFTARALRLPYDRVRRLFYGQARRVEAHEADKIRAYCEAASKLIEARQQYDQFRKDFLRDHSGLARMVPGPLPGAAVSDDREEAEVTKR